MAEKNVYLSLGSNLGDRRANLTEAVNQLKPNVAVKLLSSVFETEPAYVLNQPGFYNIVLQGSTHLAPDELLHFLNSIENGMGRIRDVRYGPRLIDLDILVYNTLQLDTPDLQIPHPRMIERIFVLAPLAEIAPDLILPGQQATVAKLAHQLGETGQGKVMQILPKLNI